MSDEWLERKTNELKMFGGKEKSFSICDAYLWRTNSNTRDFAKINIETFP